MNLVSAMRMFRQVAESRSFSGAAKQLGVSSAVVTRGIAALEAHLNARLINRTMRRISLTEAGQIYLQGCADLFTLLDRLETRVSSVTRETAGPLKIAAPELIVTTVLGDLLNAYHAVEPRVKFEVSVLANTQDLDRNDHDLWFSADRRLRDSSLACRPLMRFRDVIVASPAYLARKGKPKGPHDLADHDLLIASDIATRQWEFHDGQASHRVLVDPVLSSPNLIAVQRAALAGLGIARLPAPLVESQLGAGTLETLLDGFEISADERTMSLLYPGRQYLTQRVRNFIDFAAAYYGPTMPANRPREYGTMGNTLSQSCAA